MEAWPRCGNVAWIAHLALALPDRRQFFSLQVILVAGARYSRDRNPRMIVIAA